MSFSNPAVKKNKNKKLCPVLLQSLKIWIHAATEGMNSCSFIWGLNPNSLCFHRSIWDWVRWQKSFSAKAGGSSQKSARNFGRAQHQNPCRITGDHNDRNSKRRRELKWCHLFFFSFWIFVAFISDPREHENFHSVLSCDSSCSLLLIAGQGWALAQSGGDVPFLHRMQQRAIEKMLNRSSNSNSRQIPTQQIWLNYRPALSIYARLSCLRKQNLDRNETHGFRILDLLI